MSEIDSRGIDRDTVTVRLKPRAAIDIKPAGPKEHSGADHRGDERDRHCRRRRHDQRRWTRSASFTFVAADGAAWGNNIVVTPSTKAGHDWELDGLIAGSNKIRLKSAAGFYVNAWVEIDRGWGADKTYRQVLAIDGPMLTRSGNVMVAGTAIDVTPVPVTGKTCFTVCEFGLTATYETGVEHSSDLTLANVTGRFVEEVLRRSTLIGVLGGSLPTTTDPLTFSAGDDGLRLANNTASVGVAPRPPI